MPSCHSVSVTFNMEHETWTRSVHGYISEMIERYEPKYTWRLAPRLIPGSVGNVVHASTGELAVRLHVRERLHERITAIATPIPTRIDLNGAPLPEVRRINVIDGHPVVSVGRRQRTATNTMVWGNIITRLKVTLGDR